MTSGGGSRFLGNTTSSFSTTVETSRSITIYSTEPGTLNEVEQYIADYERPKFRLAPLRESVRFVDERLCVNFEDGRTISVPVEAYPRLAQGSDEQRANWQLTQSGSEIHWPDLDENIETPDLLPGVRPQKSR